MNVGVLTFSWAENYGAVLQAFGLCRALQSLGHSAHLINYVPPEERLRWWQGWHLRSGWPMHLHFLRRFRYEKFRHRYLPLTRPCFSLEDLRSLSSTLDAVIVGSDQVWNGNIVRASDTRYFLDFVGPRCRRISYAASFGERSQPQRTLDAAASLLPRFDALSVRDEMSADIVRRLSGRDASIVVDPTLLHDYSEILGAQTAKADYIAVYVVSRRQVPIGQRVWRALKQRLKLPVLAIGRDITPEQNERLIVSAGPSEWVRFLDRASFICTDSFHGTIFAIKRRKPFIAWPSTRVERLSSLLGACGLECRLAGPDGSVALDHLLGTSIDYDAVHRKLLTAIDRSRGFLEKALAG